MASRNRRLVMIHGRGLKPSADDLAPLWLAAMRRGIERDHGKLVAEFDTLETSFVYFGDLTAPLLQQRGATIDEQLNLADLQTALAELAARDSRKRFRSENYQRLRRRSGIGKLSMMLMAPLARGFGMEDRLLAKTAPELARYRTDETLAGAMRQRLLDVLRPALASDEDVMLVAHCVGSVVAYDCLWLMSRGDDCLDQKLTTLVTIGSPLANDSVRHGLLGAREGVERRYPGNITHWFNIAAEDDYVCHDATVANDFAPMLSQRYISRLEDIGIFNLARRYGRPNPHNALGYLIHPRMASLLADWLCGASRGSVR
jgi:hypothetical protein